jgi:hypothetical protein
MADFYTRDDSGRFTGSTAAGPAARTFTDFFEELKFRAPSPSGWVLVRQTDGTLAKVYVQNGHVNLPD